LEPMRPEKATIMMTPAAVMMPPVCASNQAQMCDEDAREHEE
jgi:hypothetical protein